MIRAIAASILLVASGGWGLAGVEDYVVEAVSPRDSLRFAMDGRTLAVTVKSATGIGGMHIGLKKDAGAWPGAVVLSFQDKDGKPLKELEGFSLAGRKMRIDGSRRTSGAMTWVELSKTIPENPKKEPRKVKVVVEKTEKAMTVTIPGKLLKGERKVRVQWVDYYR